MSTAPCLWGDDAQIGALGTFDVVLGADCIYNQDSSEMEALAATIARLLAPGGVCFIGYEHRDDWAAISHFLHEATGRRGLIQRTAEAGINHQEDDNDDDDDHILYELRHPR